MASSGSPPNTDGVTRIDPGGRQTVVAGTSARIGDIRGLAVDRDGTLYISERSGIRRVSPDGTITAVVPASRHRAVELALDQNGNLYG